MRSSKVCHSPHMVNMAVLALTMWEVVFPGAVVRLCQFHVVQAILRWDCGGGGVTKAPRISSEVKYQILRSFRVMQRCRTWEDWPTTMARFLQETYTIIFSQSATAPAEEELDPSSAEDEGTAGDIRHQASLGPKRQPKVHQPRRGGRTNSEMSTQWEFVHNYFMCNWFTDQ